MATSDSGMGLLLAGASVGAALAESGLQADSDRVGRYGDGCFVTSVSDIPVVQLPAFEEETASLGSATASLWAVDVPRGRRPSPLTLAVFGVLAGITAMALGAAAVISAGASAEAPSADGTRAVAERPAGPPVSAVERRVLGLLAKPSTERIAFRGSRGLVLAVGSGGRAAILVRGLERAAPGTRYLGWIVAPGRPPVRAARFIASERAVFLSGRLGPRASVVVSTGRPVAGPPSRNRIVAVRG